MEQNNYLLSALMPTLAKNAWNTVPDVASNKSGEMMNDFQKLLEQKAQAGKPESAPKENAAPQNGTKAPVSDQAEVPQEDPREMARKLAEAGLIPVEMQVVNLADAANVTVGPLEEGTAQEGLTVSLLGGEAAVELTAQAETAPEQENVPTGELFAAEAPVEESTAQAEVQTIQDVPTAKAEEQVEVKPQTEAPVEVEHQEQETDQVEVTDAETAPEPVFRDVKAAPIKVGDAHPAESTQQSGDVGGQVDAALANAVNNGENRVELQLTPDSLGKVTVDITYDKSGAVLSVAISAERHETQELLSRHSANLQGLLRSMGQEHVQVEVQRNQESQQQHNDQYDGHNGHNSHDPREQEHRQQHSGSSEDFLHQLRLGLVSDDDEVS